MKNKSREPPFLSLFVTVQDSIFLCSFAKEEASELPPMLSSLPSPQIIKHCRYGFFPHWNRSLRLLNMLQIVGIGIADNPASLQIRIVPAHTVEILHALQLKAGKLASRWYKTQVGQQTGAGFVDVGRDHEAVVSGSEVKHISKGNVSGRNQKTRLCTADRVIFMVVKLLAE